jgi:Cft2 family RNA processing exonuclease
MSQKGNPIQRKISVDYISFSAHVDYSQNSEFIELVKAQHVVRLSILSSLAFDRQDLRSLLMESKLQWAVYAPQWPPGIKIETKM